MSEIPRTPLFDREASHRGYKMNKMAMALGKPEGREAFKSNEEAFIDSFGLDSESKKAVMDRDWKKMISLGGNLFYLLKISAVDPEPIINIGAAQAGMSPEEFIKVRLGK